MSSAPWILTALGSTEIPGEIPGEITGQTFDFSTHFRCISRKTTKRDAFGWGKCQRKSGGPPLESTSAIVRLMLLLEDLTPGPRSGSALHRYRRPPGAGGGALLCPLMQSRGALVGGRLTGEHWCVPGRWEPGRGPARGRYQGLLFRMTGWLSRETGRFFRITGWLSRKTGLLLTTKQTSNIRSGVPPRDQSSIGGSGFSPIKVWMTTLV